MAMKTLEDCNVLFSYHLNLDYMAPPLLSERQVFCGPRVQTQDISDTVKCYHVHCPDAPPANYDIAEFITQIPSDFQPDILVVKVDASGMNFPRNLAALDIPKVLVLGDTQHMETPVRKVLEYAMSEPYDLYISDHKRHHMHFFREAGLSNVHWFPGLFLRDWNTVFSNQRSTALSFVGSHSAYHPLRVQTLNRLNESGLPFAFGSASQDEASHIMGQYLLTLNQSLNGDVNLRVFEATLAGGCLVTDRLAPQSGQELLFEDGKEILIYDSQEHLLELVEDYLSRPKEALKIARNAYLRAQMEHHPTMKRQQLSDMIFKDIVPPLYDGRGDKRSIFSSKEDLPLLFERIKRYEFLQEMHRLTPHCVVHACASVDPKLVCDLVDLPRLEIHWNGESHSPEMIQADVAQQIHLTPNPTYEDAKAIIIGNEPLSILGSSRPKIIVLQNSLDNERRQEAEEAGYMPLETYPYILVANEAMKHLTDPTC